MRHCVGDRGRLVAGDELNPPLGVFGLAMSPQTASHM